MFAFLTDGFNAVISFLSNLAGGIAWLVANIVTAIHSAVVDFANGLFLALSLLVTMLFSLLPTMDPGPVVPGGDWIGWLNWVMPVGELLAGFAALLTMFVVYLGIRYALKFVRAM